MSDAPVTRSSLLLRIRDAQDSEAWGQFVELYAPMVYGFLRKHNLQDADAADLTQEVLRSVAITARHWEYDPKRGTFRGWLFTVVRNKLRSFANSRQRRCQGTGDTDMIKLLQEQPERPETIALWDQEYDRRAFAWAADEVRPLFQEATWQAFWQTAVDGKSGKEVAERLGLSVAAVYLAKGRVMAKLKQQIRQLEEE